MLRSLALTGLLLAGAPPGGGDVVAVQAGTLYLVEDGQVIQGGGTILIRDGKIAAAGKDVEVPAGARVVDYGPDAVITPGLVDADSTYGAAIPAERTASPTLLAVDNFDPYAKLYPALRDGITSVYLAPARGRLIAGQGAVVKTGGEADDERVVSASAVIHGSITSEARRTPGYWEPPVPATVDVGLGVEEPQLPRTTMGAIVALEELKALWSGDPSLAEEYGDETGSALAGLVADGRPWRMGADSAEEVGALVDFFSAAGLPLVIDGASRAADVAERIAAAGFPVVLAPANRDASDFGKGPDAAWPVRGTAGALAAAGVEVAVSSRGNGGLRFAAALAVRDGLSAEQALRAITLAPARLLGVADRVGSLTAGKDADLAVLNGPPLSATSGVIATWVAGEVAWKAKEDGATVIEVDELHVGDGTVLRPGELLLQGGRIAEVGARVSHPPGATVVRGAAAMPGMIDALGHLGLEGSRKSFSSRFDLRRIVEPGDYADRRVAQAGVTTVNLGSRNVSGNSPTMAYKPAGEDVGRMVVAAPAALRMTWTEEVRSSSGESVRGTLEKAAEYKKKWDEYEEAIAKWSPTDEEAGDEKAEDGDGEDAEEEGEESGEDDGDDEEGEDEDDEKRKKKKGEKEPARPVTGEWQGTVKVGEEEHAARLRLLETDLALEGTLRVDLHEELIALEGRRSEHAVTLSGRPSFGWLELALELDGEKLAGKGVVAGEDTGESELSFERTSEEYPMARRPERHEPEAPKEPKDKPKEPGIDPELEPLRQAMLGKGSVIVSVSREDEILECVAEFEKHGIRPVLFGAQGATKVAGRIRGRVAGVLSDSESRAVLARSGIPVAFYSEAEEGTVELPTRAALSVSQGLSPEAMLRALTADAAQMLGIADRVGRLSIGLDGDVLLLEGSPLEVSSSVLRVWVNGVEVR